MTKVILITGGQRSGKSSYAEHLALTLTGCADKAPDEQCVNGPVYLATAHVWDEEFAKRVALHKASRGKVWTNVEEELYISKHNLSNRVVVIDCVTLWATNFFFLVNNKQEEDCNENKQSVVKQALQMLKDEFLKFISNDGTYIFVTNEIGMGGVSENKLQRQFTDLQGWANQFIAANANEVYLMVSGIAVKVK